MGKQNTDNQKVITYSSKGSKVKLRGKRLTDGSVSLYLDFYTGYKKNSTGSIITNRKLEYLNIYILPNPKNSLEKEKNKENMNVATEIRNQRESDINHSKAGMVSPYKRKANFFDFAGAYLDKYPMKDKRMIKVAITTFKDYAATNDLKPNQIDATMLEGYSNYLKKKFNGETPNSVFKRFKKILTAAVAEGLFVTNPANGVKCSAPRGLSKDFLEPHEVIALSKAVCGNSEVKRAFLFSLNTGLRHVDIVDLKYKHIKGDQLIKPQQKTLDNVVIDLNSTAIKLLGVIGNPEESVFNLPSFTSCLKTIKNWTSRAGIAKNITWHSARHSFATILLINNSDIKTVSNLLGHSSLDHTQKYTHVVNELKKKAVDKLPALDY